MEPRALPNVRNAAGRPKSALYRQLLGLYPPPAAAPAAYCRVAPQPSQQEWHQPNQKICVEFFASKACPF